MIKTPDYLVPIELAERLKEIGFDKEVHFFFLYYEGHKMLRKRGSKFGFITSDGCNPANVDNYNRIEDRTSIPTWFEVIEWFEEKIEKLREELKVNYKMSGVFEERRKTLNIKTPEYPEGLNDGVIQMKEYFIKELEELKEYYSYE